MIGRLNHVAIAVRDIAKASALYRDTLGADVSEPEPQHAHGVTTVFITLPNTKIELIAPLGHNIVAARDRLKAEGARVLGDGEPKIGAHGKPVLFLHPKDFLGTLVELEQA